MWKKILVPYLMLFMHSLILIPSSQGVEKVDVMEYLNLRKAAPVEKSEKGE